LDTSKLEALFPGIDNIKVAVRKCLIAYKNKDTNKEINDYNEDMRRMYVNMHERMQEKYEEIPIIIHHTGGNQDYLQSCVKLNSRNNKVYLIGDDANKTAYADNKNVEHVHINDLDSREVEEFKKHFVNHSSNTQSFEMNGIVRVFYIKQLIIKKGLNRVFLVDSDCIVLDNVTNIMRKCPSIKIGYSIQTFKSHIEQHFTNGMNWDNIHIDHKIPITWFKNNTPIQLVNSLHNLQPQYSSDNISKLNRYSDKITKNYFILIEDWILPQYVGKIKVIIT
jgi:hypothetical protein